MPAGKETPIRLVVQHREFETLEKQLTVAELEAGSPTGAYRLVLSPGGEIAGTVVDSNGAPAASVRVILEGPASKDVATVSSGAFRFRHLPRGVYSLTAHGGKRGVAALSGLEVGAAADLRALAVALKQESGALRGRVLDPQGRPLPGAPIQALHLGAAAAERFFTQTDSSGNFLLEGIPEGLYRVRAGDWRRGARTIPSAATGGETHEILLPPHGTLAGIIDAAGPLAPYQVRLVPAEGAAAGDEPSFLSFRFSARTIEFRCPNVPPGVYDVLIEQEGIEVARREGVFVAAGEAAPHGAPALEFRINP